MRRRSRTTRALKWVGTALCVASFAAWPVSVRVDCGYVSDAFASGCGLSYGFYWIGWYGRPVRGCGLWCKRVDPPVHSEFSLPDHTTNTGGGGTIWIPAKFGSLLIVLPTALLWWLDRRRIPVPAGYCEECGYDLTGNVSGRCPECGKPVNSD
jgi:hypothetical protein